MFNYLKSFFVKDVNALLSGLKKLFTQLEALAETEKKNVQQLVNTLEDKKAAIALAEKAAQNIKALFN